MKKQPNIIVVEGPIGAGKTTLAKTLAEKLDARLTLEDAEGNPFLPKFYADMRKWAFQTQIFFLVSRYQQQLELRERDLFHPVTVCDYMFQKDLIFARLTLSEEEFALYGKLQPLLADRVPKPDLVIWLQADVEVLMSRIRARAARFEAAITTEYIERLVRGYDEFFHRYTDAPLLIVNANEVDYRQGDVQVDELIEKIKTMESAREYYTPSRRGLA